MSWIKDKTLGFFVKTHGRFSKPLYSGMGMAFMLHRVLPEKSRNEYTFNRSLAITPERLEEHILFFKKNGFRFISLDELYNTLVEGKKPKEKFICFTLDDGYRDNYEFGLPVFRKYQVPATVYVTNCFPNGNAIFWWYLFEFHAKKNNSVKFRTSAWEKTFTWSNGHEAEKVYPQVTETIKKISRDEFRESIKNAFGISEDELEQTCKNLAMNWNELRQFSGEEGITIGAHTMNHLSLKTQEEPVALNEMKASKEQLEMELGKTIRHFAYPYGGLADADTREYLLAEKVGFATSVLNRPGNIFPSQKNFMQSIPRMPLGDDISKERLQYYMNGIYHFSNNGFKTAIPY